MTPNAALDVIVTALAELDVRLSDADSPLPNPWEEIKDQVQAGPSFYWPMYVETMRQFVAGLVAGLEGSDLDELKAALKCSTSTRDLERKLMKRLLTRAKREKVRYAPFPFEYFCYPLLNFTVYGQVLERTGLDRCHALVFSCAAPRGERGVVDCRHIESVLSREQFEAARDLGWSSPAFDPSSMRNTKPGASPTPSTAARPHRTRRVTDADVNQVMSEDGRGVPAAPEREASETPVTPPQPQPEKSVDQMTNEELAALVIQDVEGAKTSAADNELADASLTKADLDRYKRS